MPTKRIVCLANSRKLQGRCIAGKELLAGNQAGGWLRPVSARAHEEVSEYERQYSDGSDPQVLDILDVPLFHARPKNFQQENWLLDPAPYWVRVGTASLALLTALVDPVETLWIDRQSTYHGSNDEIAERLADGLTSSLRLIHVPRMSVKVFAPGSAFGNAKRRVQGVFQHADTSYRFWVTDPTYEREYLAKPDGEYSIGESFLTISLGEPYEGSVYKLIAAIIQRRDVPE